MNYKSVAFFLLCVFKIDGAPLSPLRLFAEGSFGKRCTEVLSNIELSDSEQKALYLAAESARLAYKKRLEAPCKERYVDKAIPKNLVAQIERIASSYAIHPHSFDIDMVLDQTSKAAFARIRATIVSVDEQGEPSYIVSIEKPTIVLSTTFIESWNDLAKDKQQWSILSAAIAEVLQGGNDLLKAVNLCKNVFVEPQKSFWDTCFLSNRVKKGAVIGGVLGGTLALALAGFKYNENVLNLRRKQTLARIKEILLEEEKKAYKKARKAGRFFDNRLRDAFDELVDSARDWKLSRYKRKLLKPRLFVWQRGVPSELASRTRILALSRGINPDSFNMMVKENLPDYCYAAASSNAPLGPTIYFSKKLVDDDRLFFNRIAIDNTLDHELTHIEQGHTIMLKMLPFKWRLYRFLMATSPLNPVADWLDNDPKIRASNHASRLSEVNADTLGSIESFERALNRRGVSLIMGSRGDYEHFPSHLTDQWTDIILRAHLGSRIETLEPKIQKLLNQQELLSDRWWHNAYN